MNGKSNNLAEITIRAVLLGVILSVVFAVFLRKKGLVIPPGDAITKPKRRGESILSFQVRDAAICSEYLMFPSRF